MLSPEMAGTVKLTVPPALPVGGVLTGGAEALGGGGVVATAGAVLAAECVAAGEVAGADVEGGPDAGDEPAAVAKAVPEAGADAALDEGDPPPHAVRPTPPITAAAMITTGTRRILMLLMVSSLRYWLAVGIGDDLTRKRALSSPIRPHQNTDLRHVRVEATGCWRDGLLARLTWVLDGRHGRRDRSDRKFIRPIWRVDPGVFRKCRSQPV